MSEGYAAWGGGPERGARYMSCMNSLLLVPLMLQIQTNKNVHRVHQLRLYVHH